VFRRNTQYGSHERRGLMDYIDDCERVLSARCLKLKKYTELDLV
jgi:hypothetical protein